MRTFSLHRSSISRFSGRGSSIKSGSIGKRNSYKLRKSSSFESYLQEAKKLAGDTEETEKTQKQESIAQKYTSAASRYRTKAAEYKATGSKFNLGTDDINESIDSFTKILAEEDPDMEKAYKAAEQFTEGYNSVFSSIRSSASRTVSGKASYISSVTHTFSRALENVGIKEDKDGKLTVDKEAFMKSDARYLSAIFGKKSSYASYIRDQAANINQLAAIGSDTYSTSSSKASSYLTSAYSGSFFDKMF